MSSIGATGKPSIGAGHASLFWKFSNEFGPVVETVDWNVDHCEGWLIQTTWDGSNREMQAVFLDAISCGGQRGHMYSSKTAHPFFYIVFDRLVIHWNDIATIWVYPSVNAATKGLVNRSKQIVKNFAPLVNHLKQTVNNSQH